MKEIIESLSPIERKVLQVILYPLKEIQKRTSLDETSVLRALHFLEQKGIIKREIDRHRVIGLGVNGVYYKKTHLPERNLL